MQLPTPLSRLNKNAHKNFFGHVLIIAGSQRMLGAGALAALAALRSGAGLVTLGIPKSLNLIAQKKVSNEIMTFPLPETKDETLSISALKDIIDFSHACDAIAIGPGLSTHSSTKKLVLKLISTLNKPLIIDADALNILALSPEVLLQTTTPKIITPHPGEMARLIHKKTEYVQKNRRELTVSFAKKFHCTVLLKGAKTVISSWNKNPIINTTGNSGMATAGSGDVLTGMIAAFLGQGLETHLAAKWGAFLHGKAGDLAALKKTKISLIASDIIETIPKAIQSIK